jgi:hypothetical protein
MRKRQGILTQPNQAGPLAGEKQSDIASSIEFIDFYRKTDISTAVANDENTNESNHMCPTVVGPFILPSIAGPHS